MSVLAKYQRAQSMALDRYEPLISEPLRRWMWARADSAVRPLFAEVIAHMPPQIAPRILGQWEKHVDRDGHKAGHRYLWGVRQDLLPELFPEAGLPFHAEDSDIEDKAERAANSVRSRLRLIATDAEAWAMLGRTARSRKVKMPSCASLEGVRARMTDARWWRRALSKRYRVMEHAAIKAGCVHRHAAPYVSDDAYRRFERRARKTARFLEAFEAVNESTGEMLPLEEAAAGSLANPANRRMAVMACVRGLEERATALGFEGVFVTITCPSRMHAWLSSGEPNPHYDQTSPDRAQAYIQRKVWNSATRKLARLGIKPGRRYFGFRAVEPHHDATPHWHLLIFIDPRCRQTLLDTLRNYALLDSGQEPGAQERRFVQKEMSPGAAAGYVAKYIAKGIDGHGVGEDTEAGGPATSTAKRVVAWVRGWGFRQFQFFGCATLTPFRELYRLDRVPAGLETPLGDSWSAAREGDFCAYLGSLDAHGVKLSTLRPHEPSRRYPGEIARPLRGIVAQDDSGSFQVVTRPDRWSIRPRLDRVSPSLGLDSITPRDIVLTGFLDTSDTSNSRKTSPASTTKHRKSGGATGQTRARVALCSWKSGRGQGRGGESAPDRAPLPGQGHSR